MKKKSLLAIITAAVMLSVSSCGGSNTAVTTRAADPAANGGESYIAGDSIGETAPGTTAAAAYDDSYSPEDYSYDADFISESSEGAAYGDSKQNRAGLLTGGEWHDNSNFTFWKRLFDQRSDWADEIEKWKLDPRSRVLVRIKDSNGAPAAGMTVKLAEGNTIIWETVTDSRGEAFLMAGLDPANKRSPDKIIAETSDGRAVTSEMPANFRDTDTAVELTVPDSFPMRTKLDLMLMLDTTGSMGDELKYLQTELESVIDRVVSGTNADVQLSVNFYRDNGDDYVVRDFGFTKNISIALDHLSDQRANGGGDYPEAVMDAIGNGLYKHDWRADSEKIMLLVLDAPPHLSDGIAYMKDHATKAAQMGVRIIPVASSGVDTDTEFLCRTLAIATGGTYTFLTDDSGIGNSHLEPTVGSYTVEKLNDMLVRIICDYFSQEPRTYASSETSQQQDTVVLQYGAYPASYRITSDYFSGEGMYTSGAIRNEQELAEFIDKYGFSPLSYDIDFKSMAIAYNIDLLSSGSITVDDSKGVYCTIEDGEPVFHYELLIPEVGTADIKTLIIIAEVPSPRLMYEPEPYISGN